MFYYISTVQQVTSKSQ